MRTILLSLLLTFVLVGCKAPGSAAATEPAPTEKASAAADDGQGAAAEIPEISVDDAGKALQSGAVAVDANSEKTRKKNGTVPDAVILTSSYKYDLAQLPEDKSKDLIFYCSNTNCTARARLYDWVRERPHHARRHQRLERRRQGHQALPAELGT